MVQQQEEGRLTLTAQSWTHSPTHPVLAAQGDTAAGLCPSPAWELINYVSS